MRIDPSSLSTQINRNLQSQLAQAGQAMRRISSGQQINQASDDPAGLAVSMRLLAELTAADQGSENALDGISMLQTAEGALGQTTELIGRARELAVQAGNGTLTSADRDAINLELTEITRQIDSIAGGTEFNTKKLLDGSQTSVTIQTGASQATTFSLPNASSAALGLSGLDANNAAATIQALDGALEQVLSNRSRIGATVNGLQKTYEVRQVAAQNMAASHSRIRDADLARQASELARANLMSQASLAMSAQASQIGAGVLSLLR
ncbi:MAG: flagellin [Candidatus Sericytochromatia bacterium]|nr:flagellin [Candidatus Tanganyikabacteria bacterium]